MRLIDADALQKLLLPISIDLENEYGSLGGAVSGVMRHIDNAPTVDAAPVVHGRWVFEYWKSGYIKRCYCSECGNPPKDAYIPTNYCDHCGAKMDRKDDEKCG